MELEPISTVLSSPRRWIWVIRYGNWCSWAYIRQEKYQRIYGTTIYIIYNIGKTIILIVRICGARAILILFYDNQDTESESLEIEMILAGPIFTHKNISKAPWGKDIHTYLDRIKILWKFFIFMELEPFSYYSLITKTPKLSNKEWALVYLG